MTTRELQWRGKTGGFIITDNIKPNYAIRSSTSKITNKQLTTSHPDTRWKSTKMDLDKCLPPPSKLPHAVQATLICSQEFRSNTQFWLKRKSLNSPPIFHSLLQMFTSSFLASRHAEDPITQWKYATYSWWSNQKTDFFRTRPKPVRCPGK